MVGKKQDYIIVVVGHAGVQSIRFHSQEAAEQALRALKELGGQLCFIISDNRSSNQFYAAGG